MTETIRILLIDDQTTIRHALQVLLEQEQDFEIVGSAANGLTGIEQAQHLQPDVALIDIEMPGMNGIATAQKIRECSGDTKVLMLTSHEGDGYLAEAFRAGAKGYLLKTTPREDLASAIRAVYKGYGQVSPGLLEKVVTQTASSNGTKTATAAPPTVAQPTTLTYPPQLEQVIPDMELRLLLKEFSAETLMAALQRLRDPKVGIALLNYLNQFLKSEPTNVSALFVCGVLSRHSHPQAAIAFLRVGMREGLRQQIPPPVLWPIYQEGAKINPQEAFSWLLQSGSPWLQSDERLSQIVREAAGVYSSDSEQYQTCLTLYRLRAWSTMSDRYLALQPRLETLRQRLSQLNGTLK